VLKEFIQVFGLRGEVSACKGTSERRLVPRVWLA